MKRGLVSAVILSLGFLGLAAAKAFADDGDLAAQRVQIEQTVQAAFSVQAHRIEQAVNNELGSYHPLPIDEINHMTSVKELRSRLIVTQAAVEAMQSVVADAANPASAPQPAGQSKAALQAQSTLTTAVSTNALAQTLLQTDLSNPASVPLGGTRALAVYDTTQSGLAPAIPPAQSTTCNVMSYITGAFGASGPQFISNTGQTVGQKNTLSIIGFALGIVPIALNCTAQHSTTPMAGKPQATPTPNP